jgi:predicted peroxiredoxin
MDAQEQEQEQVGKIALDWYRKTSKSEAEARKALAELVNMVKEDGIKLVHLGNVLFLIFVRGKGVVEFKIIGDEKNSQTLFKDLENLAAYLKNIGVKMAYTYMVEDKFYKQAQATKLNLKRFKAKIQGKMNTVYALEL